MCVSRNVVWVTLTPHKAIDTHSVTTLHAALPPTDRLQQLQPLCNSVLQLCLQPHQYYYFLICSCDLFSLGLKLLAKCLSLWKVLQRRCCRFTFAVRLCDLQICRGRISPCVRSSAAAKCAVRKYKGLHTGNNVSWTKT